MKDGKLLFSAAWIAMTLAVGTARGGSITIPSLGPARSELTTGLSGGGPLDLPSLAMSPEGLASPNLRRQHIRLVVATVEPSSISAEQASRVPEPTSMGLFGIGITGLITLRRFRKFFA